ncbi:MAG: sulfatase-like hydrolase/transferase [Bellilinea sp.]
MVSFFKKNSVKPLTPYSLLITNLIVSTLYVSFEWLFIVTKPSFMSVLSITEKIWVLIFGAIFLSAITSIPLLILIFLNALLTGKTHSGKLISLGFILPVLTATFMVFLLIDNFTYTVFRIGIVFTTGYLRGIYALCLIVIGFILFYEVFRFGAWIDSKNKYGDVRKRRQRKLAVILGAMFIVSLGVPLVNGIKNPNGLDVVEKPMVKNAPNIILFTIESLDASHMSVYGYDRDTTPFLEELSKDSLIALNAFSNAQGTTGSITSILTGKDPMDTRIILAHDILRGEDSYQHLPGILKTQGYHTYQLSFNWYADAIDLNFLNAFDTANGRREAASGLPEFVRKYLPSDNGYFNYELITRLGDRLKHIFYIEEMDNPYLQLTKSMEQFNDRGKLQSLATLLDEEDQPAFVHFHWMGTHGPYYFPQNRHFSSGKDIDDQEKYDMDFYDDSILEMDKAIESLYTELASGDLTERETVLVIASDHSVQWTKSRLPLIFHFPDHENSKVIEENAQNLDIAPTLLDYLDIPQPTWMAGQSLFTQLDKSRPIFTTVVGQAMVKKVSGKEVTESVDWTFSPFGKLSVLVCDKWYEIKFESAVIHWGSVDKYKGSCGDERLTRNQAVDLMIEHLQDNGFDASVLINKRSSNKK